MPGFGSSLARKIAGAGSALWAPLSPKEFNCIFCVRRNRSSPWNLNSAAITPPSSKVIEPEHVINIVSANGREFPDPVSRYQPEGVHGPSEVVDSAFPWTDRQWFGLPIEKYVIYELHVGTFTPEGTFEAVIPYLDELSSVGITAIEIMPVAQFPEPPELGL